MLVLTANLYAVAIRRGKQYTARGHSLCDGNPVVLRMVLVVAVRLQQGIPENISTCMTGPLYKYLGAKIHVYLVASATYCYQVYA